jgi:hypothetical protein
VREREREREIERCSGRVTRKPEICRIHSAQANLVATGMQKQSSLA